MRLHAEWTLLVLCTIMLAPLAWPFAALVVWRLRQRERPLTRSRMVDWVIALGAGYLLAFTLFVAAKYSGQLPGFFHHFGSLFTLADGCGLVRGTSEWLGHLDDPEYGHCEFCDDIDIGPGYRPEFRSLYCPDKRGS